MKVFFLFLLLYLTSCSNISTIKGSPLDKIESSKVIFAEIKSTRDSLVVPLSQIDIEKFADIVNESDETQVMKAMTLYVVSIQLENDSVLSYKMNIGAIGQYSSYIKTDETKYFRERYRFGHKVKSKIAN